MPPQVIGTGRSIDSEFNSRENLPRPRHWHRSWCKTTKKKPLPVFKFSHPRAVWKQFCPLYVSMLRWGKIQVALLLNNAKSDKEVCKKKLQASPVLNTALHTLGLIFLAWLHCCCWVVGAGICAVAQVSTRVCGKRDIYQRGCDRRSPLLAAVVFVLR